MNLTFKRLNDKAVLPTISKSGNVFDITCIGMATGIGKDGRMILEYRTGLEIHIPEGHVGMLFLADGCFLNSLVMTNAVSTFFPGEPKEITAKFKTNTDSVPAIYEDGEVFAKMIIVALPMLEVTELPMDAKEVEQAMTPELAEEIEEVDVEVLDAPVDEQ